MKSIIDFRVIDIERLGKQTVMLHLKNPNGALPTCRPGQFVQLRVDGGKTFLRRPISIHYADEQKGELWLLVSIVGEGTRWMSELMGGDIVNVVMPLGNGFSQEPTEHPLLVGGGVGVAPLYHYGVWLRQHDVEPTFLIGARTESLLLRREAFETVGRVYVTTEDGSTGERGFVTQHSILEGENFTSVHVCGPAPMMKAVARWAKSKNVTCEVSLENMMACGLGACLCCVEKTVKGNVCVCTEGPVFDIKELTW